MKTSYKIQQKKPYADTHRIVKVTVTDNRHEYRQKLDSITDILDTLDRINTLEMISRGQG